MTRLELPSSTVAMAQGPDRAAAVGLGPPHNGLLIVGRVVGRLGNVDPGGRRHCCYICNKFPSFEVMQAKIKSKTRGNNLSAWRNGSAKRLEEKTKELDPELHLPQRGISV